MLKVKKVCREGWGNCRPETYSDIVKEPLTSYKMQYEPKKSTSWTLTTVICTFLHHTVTLAFLHRTITLSFLHHIISLLDYSHSTFLHLTIFLLSLYHTTGLPFVHHTITLSKYHPSTLVPPCLCHTSTGLR